MIFHCPSQMPSRHWLVSTSHNWTITFFRCIFYPTQILFNVLHPTSGPKFSHSLHDPVQIIISEVVNWWLKHSVHMFSYPNKYKLGNWRLRDCVVVWTWPPGLSDICCKELSGPPLVGCDRNKKASLVEFKNASPVHGVCTNCGGPLNFLG